MHLAPLEWTLSKHPCLFRVSFPSLSVFAYLFPSFLPPLDRCFTSEEDRESLIELLFDTFQVHSLFLARSAVLASFCFGLLSCVFLFFNLILCTQTTSREAHQPGPRLRQERTARVSGGGRLRAGAGRPLLPQGLHAAHGAVRLRAGRGRAVGDRGALAAAALLLPPPE